MAPHCQKFKFKFFSLTFQEVDKLGPTNTLVHWPANPSVLVLRASGQAPLP